MTDYRLRILLLLNFSTPAPFNFSLFPAALSWEKIVHPVEAKAGLQQACMVHYVTVGAGVDSINPIGSPENQHGILVFPSPKHLS